MELLNIYGQHMVFQQKESFLIKGKKVNSSLEIYFINSKKKKIIPNKIKINKNKTFEASFIAPKGSFEPYKLVAISKKDRIELEPVFFGDLYLTMGQSNMAYPLSAVEEADKYSNKVEKQNLYCLNFVEADIEAKDPCFVKRPFEPLEEIAPFIKWNKLDKTNSLTYSALSVMATSLIADVCNYPVAFIHTSMGGLSIESYLPKTAVDKKPSLIKKLKDSGLYLTKSTYNTCEGRNYAQLYGVFNEKIAPLKGLKFKAAIYYQGESSCYDELKAIYQKEAMETIISSYRDYFNQKDLPFLLTDIADCFYPYKEARGYNLVNEVMENITMKNVYIVPTYDIESRWVDVDNKDVYYHPIHPRNKEPIALRYFELINLNLLNKNNFNYPAIKSYSLKGCSLLVTVNLTKGDELVKDKNYYGFSISGRDGIYYPATVKVISPKTFEIHSDYVKNPTQFTYAFEQYNYLCNFKTKLGYPLIPYRSKKCSINEATFLFDECVLSCNYLSLVKEDNFGYECGGGFLTPIVEPGSIIHSSVNVELDKSNKTFLDCSIKATINKIVKKDNYYYFSVKFNLGYSGIKHNLSKFKYLHVDLKSDNNVEFHGALFRTNGFIYKFPVVTKKGEIKQFINLNNRFSRYGLSLEHYLDGSECVYNKNTSLIDSIVSIELYFRTSQKAFVNIDNIVLSNSLDQIDDIKEKIIKKEADDKDAAVVIMKN